LDDEAGREGPALREWQRRGALPFCLAGGHVRRAMAGDRRAAGAKVRKSCMRSEARREAENDGVGESLLRRGFAAQAPAFPGRAVFEAGGKQTQPSLTAYLGVREVRHPGRGKVRFRLYPYQRRLLRSRAKQRIVVKARQVGVSQVVAGEALYVARYRPGASVLFVSRNLSAARHLLEMVYVLMESDGELGKPRRGNTTELVLENGSVIRSLPATKRTGRTFSATAVYLDEFAHMPWAERIYQAVAPCAAQGGRLTVISTPSGRGNAFHRLWQEAVSGVRAFEAVRVHWSDCPEYNPKGHRLEDPEERRRVGEAGEWYREQRGRFTDEQWAEEYECDFIGSGSLVYREFDPAVHVGAYRYNREWATYVGQDFGYVNPSVALVVQVNPSEEVFVIEEHYHTNRSISDLAREVYRPACDRYGVKAWYCDPSGRSEIAELRAAGMPAVGKRSTVEEGVVAIRKLLRPPGGGGPRLHIDRGCKRLIAEMGTYSYREGTDQVGKDENDHGPDALRYFVVNRWGGKAEVEGVGLR